MSNHLFASNSDAGPPRSLRCTSANHTIRERKFDGGAEARAPAMVFHDLSVAPLLEAAFWALILPSFIKTDQNTLFFSIGPHFRFTNDLARSFGSALADPSQVCGIAVGLASPFILPQRELDSGSKSAIRPLYAALRPLGQGLVFDPLGHSNHTK